MLIVLYKTRSGSRSTLDFLIIVSWKNKNLRVLRKPMKNNNNTRDSLGLVRRRHRSSLGGKK